MTSGKRKTLRTENVSAVARSSGSSKGLTTKGHKGIFWIDELFCILTVWELYDYAFVKIHRMYSKKSELHINYILIF